MGKVNELLSARLKKTETSPKMALLAHQSANGTLTSFSGIFSIVELSDREKAGIKEILNEYAFDQETVDDDWVQLISITSEVKAITNQAALLHGERIKKAQTILINYREGAFTAWLLATYGNRQTPYNLLQYYEFCEAMPKTLRGQIEAMPRQAIYTLASREGSFDKKQQLVEAYDGQTKSELLSMIREAFPLEEKDGRKRKVGELTIQALKRLHRELKKVPGAFTKTQKEAALSLLEDIRRMISHAK